MTAIQHQVWSERYEALRSEALSANQKTAGSAGRGLMLFLRRGFAAWMGAWQSNAPSPPRTSPPLGDATVPGDLRRQLASVLADLMIRKHGGKAG